VSDSRFVLGIAGPSGSGKTSLANSIELELKMRKLSEELVKVSEDNFYLSMGSGELRNFDHPESIDHNKLHVEIEEFLKSGCLTIPKYCFNTHSRLDEIEVVKDKRLLILEGILWLSNPKIRELMDVIIYVDTPQEVCLLRRLARDVVERGRTYSEITEQFETQVRPMFLKYIQPNKKYATFCMSGEGGLEPKAKALASLLVDKVK
jgi:uridine kinase